MSGGPPSRALADWLRDQRTRRGWNIAQMARRLAEAAGAIAMPGIPPAHVLTSYVSRWEWAHCGVSPRYRLLYCAAFGIPPDGFGPPGTTPPPAAGPGIAVIRLHPPGTGAGKRCGFTTSCTTPARFILQPTGPDSQPLYVCDRDLTHAINELIEDTGTTVIVQQITWPPRPATAAAPV